MQQLRLPAETMSQKLYNVGVALEALKEAGVSLHDFLSNRAEESVQLDDMGGLTFPHFRMPLHLLFFFVFFL